MIAGVIGVIGVLFILLVLHFLLDNEKHFIFQLLLIIFVMVGAFLVVPKMVIDSYAVCEPVVANTSTIGAVVTYEYSYFCFQRPETTSQTYYNISTTMFYLFIGYLVVFLAFWGFFMLKDSVSGGKRG